MWQHSNLHQGTCESKYNVIQSWRKHALRGSSSIELYIYIYIGSQAPSSNPGNHWFHGFCKAGCAMVENHQNHWFLKFNGAQRKSCLFPNIVDFLNCHNPWKCRDTSTPENIKTETKLAIEVWPVRFWGASSAKILAALGCSQTRAADLGRRFFLALYLKGQHPNKWSECTFLI